MNYIENYEQYSPYGTPMQDAPERVPFSIFFIMLFITGAVSVSLLPGFNLLVIGLGFIAAVMFLIASIRQGFQIAPEVICYVLFLIWALLGFMVVLYPHLFVTRMVTLFQFVIMVVVIAHYAQNARSCNRLLLAVLIGIGIISLGSVVTGDFRRAVAEGQQLEGELSMNANTFGISVTLGMVILLYFFRVVRSLLVKVGILAVLFACVLLVIASGSRKSFVVIGPMLLSWFYFSYRKEFFKKPHVALAAMLLLIGFGAFALYQARDTVLFERLVSFKETLQGGGSEGSTLSRITMIKEGIQMTLSHPLLGIGVNHFPIYSSTEKYAHNNYVEIFATTGMLGGILFHMIYLKIILRLIRLSRLSLSHNQRELLTLGKCFMIMLLFFDLFIVSYTTKPIWILLAIIIGFTYTLEKQIKLFSEMQPAYLYDDSWELS